MAKPTSGIFEKMEFPDYEYVEYPKLLRDASGNKVRVLSLEEEKALLKPVKAA